MDTLKIRVNMEYEFRRGNNATQTARNIKNDYGENCTNERTTRYWFSRFRSGNLDLKNEARGRPETLVNNDELKVIVEADETQSTAELAAAFDAIIIQQHAEVKFFDERFISEAAAFTRRQGRGTPYLTNVTIVTRQTIENNVTIKVVANVKTVGNIVFHDMKICDGIKISWIRLMKDMYSNFTDCPIPAGSYKVYNLELPPKNFPLPIPKGEGTLHLYAYKTASKELLFHILMKVASV